MPLYQNPVHGASISEALAEAAARAPVTRVMLHTFELYHPLGTVDPIYVVADQQALMATIEATADRNPSTIVEFLPISIMDTRPEESDQAPSPEITLTISNVSGLTSDAVRRARGSLVPWIIIERIYASDDTSGPAILPPMQMYVVGFDITSETVTLRCSFGDSVNVAVPKATFSRDQYPTLIP